MGHSSYSFSDRTVRSVDAGYSTKSISDIFVQSRSRRIYEKMNPANVAVRESRDSDAHPETVPVQLYLDVTGSMGSIPHMFIKEGLPKMISGIIQAGVPDVALMFGAIGDHECDSYPLQVAQFESGDAELDYWLTHTYLEGGGGGNAGESYALAWYFAGNHVSTDAFEKRNKKGFVFTIGDEPVLKSYPARAISHLMEKTAALAQSATVEELLERAQEQNHVYHIHIAHSNSSRQDRVIGPWKDLLGENLMIVDDYTQIPKIIADKIVQMTDSDTGGYVLKEKPVVTSTVPKPIEEIL